jgi:hypothetical protein
MHVGGTRRYLQPVRYIEDGMPHDQGSLCRAHLRRFIRLSYLLIVPSSRILSLNPWRFRKIWIRRLVISRSDR